MLIEGTICQYDYKWCPGGAESAAEAFEICQKCQYLRIN